MNDRQIQLMDNRGRVIAQVFYSELEKISVAAIGKRTVGNLGENLAALTREQVGTKAGKGGSWLSRVTGFGEGGVARGELAASKGQTQTVRQELSKRRAEAQKLRQSGDAVEREQGRTQLAEINAAFGRAKAPKTPKGEGRLPTGTPTPSPGPGASKGVFAKARDVVGTAGLIGGGGFLGYKGYKKLKGPSDPYSQYA